MKRSKRQPAAVARDRPVGCAAPGRVDTLASARCYASPHCRKPCRSRPVVLVTGAARRIGRADRARPGRARLRRRRALPQLGRRRRADRRRELAARRRRRAWRSRPTWPTRPPAGRWCPRCWPRLRPARRRGQQRLDFRVRRRRTTLQLRARWIAHWRANTAPADRAGAGAACAPVAAAPRPAASSTCSTRSSGTRTPTTSRTRCRRPRCEAATVAAGAGAGAARARLRRRAGCDAAVGPDERQPNSRRRIALTPLQRSSTPADVARGRALPAGIAGHHRHHAAGGRRAASLRPSRATCCSWRATGTRSDDLCTACCTTPTARWTAGACSCATTRCWINIGVHDFEKTARRSALLINVDLYVPLAAVDAACTIELDEVVDYDFIRRMIVAERVARGHVHLQETLCDDLLAADAGPPARARRARLDREARRLRRLRRVGCEVFGHEGERDERRWPIRHGPARRIGRDATSCASGCTGRSARRLPTST